MYTQLWVMFLLPPTLAQCYVTLRDGRGYAWATPMLAATLLSHLLIGYIALASVVLLALLGLLGPGSKTTIWVSGKRLLLLLTLVAIVTAYFWIPFLLDSAYFNHSVFEESRRFDSFGHRWVLGALVQGKLFDQGRWPVLTILTLAGFVVCLRRWRDERFRIPVVLFIVWLLFYFGRPTWGALFDLLPLGRELRLNRMIAGVHLGGIYLAGIGLAVPWQWAFSRKDRRHLIVPAILTALVLFPAYQERRAYLGRSATMMRENRAAYLAEVPEIDALVGSLEALPPGRVYAGHRTNWGMQYRVGDIPFYALLPIAGFDMVGQLYHALSLNSDVQASLNQTRPDHYDLFNIRYIVLPKDWPMPEYFQVLQDFGRHRIYSVPTSGYFDLVNSDLTFVGDKTEFFAAASYWLNSNLIRLKQHPTICLDGTMRKTTPVFPLDEAVEVMGRATFRKTSLPGRVFSETITGNTCQAEVVLSRKALLMLKVTYHPNWRATVDGSPAETSMLMPSFIGVQVPPGAHQVKLTYRPRVLRSTLLVLGLLTLPLIALVEGHSRKRRQ